MTEAKDDSLDRLFRTSEVAQLEGMSTRWLAEKVRTGKFPKPDVPAEHPRRARSLVWQHDPALPRGAEGALASRLNIPYSKTPAGRRASICRPRRPTGRRSNVYSNHTPSTHPNKPRCICGTPVREPGKACYHCSVVALANLKLAVPAKAVQAS
jgi:hypothetical protein